MKKYIRNLLTLALVATSACLVTPCQAQTSVKSKSENPNNIIPVSSQSPTAVDTNISNTSSNSTNSTNNKPIASSNATAPATKPNPRIPISSRVFTAPSMEQ